MLNFCIVLNYVCSMQETGDNDKTKPTTAEGWKVWHKRHMSVEWGKPPLMDVEPEHQFMCCLHLLLGVTRVLFQRGVQDFLIGKNKKKRTMRVNILLKKLGVNVTAHENKEAESESSPRVLGVIGSEAMTILRYYDSLVDLAVDSSDADAVAKGKLW
jgi:hypothetical protein